MDDNRRSKFEELLNDTRTEINSLENQIEEELAAIKQRLANLQDEKKHLLTIYGSYCQLCGVENELAEDDDEDDDELE